MISILTLLGLTSLVIFITGPEIGQTIDICSNTTSCLYNYHCCSTKSCCPNDLVCCGAGFYCCRR
uniref:Cysteine rich secreted protein n=1 Tax=Riptortus pedestris TaxID=329032 RepID=R4WRE3_RIPPE|nr:cysteine rich secreted protein [Riptortus pedestris]